MRDFLRVFLSRPIPLAGLVIFAVIVALALLAPLLFARGPFTIVGMPLLPPGAPEAAIRILRTSFNAILKDPEFLAEAERRKIDLSGPMTGVEIHALLDDLYAQPPEIIQKAIAASDTREILKR
jgi:hypothetical protein